MEPTAGVRLLMWLAVGIAAFAFVLMSSPGVAH